MDTSHITCIYSQLPHDLELELHLFAWREVVQIYAKDVTLQSTRAVDIYIGRWQLHHRADHECLLLCADPSAVDSRHEPTTA